MNNFKACKYPVGRKRYSWVNPTADGRWSATYYDRGRSGQGTFPTRAEAIAYVRRAGR